MHAKRFRLDAVGNLHADGLFCRLLDADAALLDDVSGWIPRKRLYTRAAKAQALIEFEAAMGQGNQARALDLARTIHVLMLAQRTTNKARKSGN